MQLHTATHVRLGGEQSIHCLPPPLALLGRGSQAQRPWVRGPPSRAATTSTEATWDEDSWSTVFDVQPDAELSYAITRVQGTIPSDLAGTLFRNGPGLCSTGTSGPYSPLDGHGMLCRVALSDGAAHFSNRFVRTPTWQREMANGYDRSEIMFRGVDVNKPRGNFMDLRKRAVANTAVCEWGGELLALWEASAPTVIDPVTLDTVGPASLGGEWPPSRPVTAHPKLDPLTDRMVAFGMAVGEGKLYLTEVDSQNRLVGGTRTWPVPDRSYMHDFSITQDWVVFFAPPTRVDLKSFAQYLWGTATRVEGIHFDMTERGRWMLFNRHDADAPPVILEAEGTFIWHHANAYQRDDGTIVLDACTYEEFSLSSADLRDPPSITPSDVKRFVLDPEAGSYTSSVLTTTSCDFPCVSRSVVMREHRYIFLAGAANRTDSFPHQRIIKLDTVTGEEEHWQCPAHTFLGEPTLAPRSGSEGGVADDEGYVLTFGYDGRSQTACLYILDAAALGDGPVAVLHLEQPIGFGFHTHWSPAN